MPDEARATLAALFDQSAEPETKAETQPEQKVEPKAETQPELKAEPEAPEPEADKAPVDDDDAAHVETLADLAEVLGTDVSELYNIRVPVTSADGDRAEVSISEWKDAYQASQRTTKLQQELEQKRAAWEQQTQAAQQQIQQQLQQTGALLNAAEKQLVAEYESVDWEGLRQSDPAEWAAKRQTFLERQKAINDAKSEAVTSAQKLQAEQAEKTKAQRTEVLQREADAMRQAIPEWRDETKAKAEQAQLFDYLVSEGFPPEAVGEISNHRLVVLARKAMLWDRRSQEGAEAKKKLVKVAPKRVLKPGAAQTKSDQQADAAKAKRDRLKKTGRVEDFAALFSES